MIERVSFRNARGELLAGDLSLPAEGLVRGIAVVLCHGMESSRSGLKHVRLANELAARGFPTLRFDFAGCGASEGRFEDMTYTREVTDLDAAVSFLVNRGVDRLALFGSSMGGAVAILFAGSDRPAAKRVVGVATLAAVARPDRVPSPMLSLATVERWQRDGYLPLSEGRRVGFTLMEDARRIDIPGAAARVRVPALILHGSADEVVPVGDGRELFDAIAHERRELDVVEGADHRFSSPTHLDHAIVRLVNWLAASFGP